MGGDTHRGTLVDTINDTADFGRVGIGIDRATNFEAQDGLYVDVRLDGGIVSVRNSIDSDGNGRVNDADADVRLVSGDLVLDIDALYRRATADDLGLGDQHVVLADTTSIGAGQILRTLPDSDFIV